MVRDSGPYMLRNLFQGEVHLERRLRRPPVHEAEIEARADLADLVAVVAVDTRGLGIVEDQGRSAVAPTRALVEPARDGADAEEPVDGPPALGVEHLPLPDDPRPARDRHGPARAGVVDRPAADAARGD